MPHILVPSSAKRIATQILVIAKLNGENTLFWEFLFVVSFIAARNYLFSIKNVNVNNIQYYRCQWHRSRFFIVNGKHISNFVLIVHIEQTNNVCVFILKGETFLKTISRISCVMYYFKCKQNLWTSNIWNYTITTLWVNQWQIFAKEFASDVHSS